jgi:arginase family enzyme
MSKALTSFVGKMKTLPSRGAEWVNRVGPVAYWGVGSDVNTDHRKGAALGPAAVREALHCPYGGTMTGDNYTKMVWTADTTAQVEAPPSASLLLPVLDVGDMLDTDGTATSQQWHDAIRAGTSTLTEKGYIPVTVGGDQSITLPALQGIHDVLQSNIVLVHFGGFASMSPTSPTGNAYSHNCTFHSVLQQRMVKGLLQFGTRNVTKDQRTVRREFETKYVDANGIIQKSPSSVKDIRNDYPIYISIDVGVLDPAFAPGVSRCSCGGLSTRELLHLLSVLRAPKVVGIDIVETNPQLDNSTQQLTAHAAAKLVKEAITKAYTVSTMTAAEGQKMIEEKRMSGEHPPKYPDM